MNDANFGSRQVGTGSVAEIIADTFRMWSTKLGYDEHHWPLNCDAFRPPQPTNGQQRLF